MSRKKFKLLKIHSNKSTSQTLVIQILSERLRDESSRNFLIFLSVSRALEIPSVPKKVYGSEGGGVNSAYYVTGMCHFAQKIGTHISVNSCGL